MIILGTNSIKDTGYDVDNSLRFNDGSSDYLSRTNGGSPTSSSIFTFSCWIKKSQGVPSEHQVLFGNFDSTDNTGYFRFNDDATMRYFDKQGGSTRLNYTTPAVFRDVSAWYNLVINVDTSRSSGDRVRIFSNGTQLTTSVATDTSGNLGLLTATSSNGMTVGAVKRPPSPNYEYYYDGYMCEAVFIDGQALAPDQFGEFDQDSGIWKPINVSGLTFGNNGFYLETKQSGTSQNSSGLGADTSGNDNHFAVNNLTAIDQSTDTCTNNFATWNPLVHYSTSATFSEGNLKVAPTENTSRVYTVSTIAMPTVSGSKWYAEFKYLETNDVAIIGILDAAQISYVFHNNSDLDNQNGDTSVGRVTYRSGNGLIKFPSGQSVDSSVTLTNNDIVMIALDSGSGKIWFGVNGTWFNSGNPATGSNGVDFTGQSWWTAGVDDFVFFVGDGNTGGHDDWEANFGSPPYSESGGETDGNGYGNFAHAVPSGYYSLNTKNLAEYG